MPEIQEVNGTGPLPRFMSDLPEPDYDRILEQLAESASSRIGCSFFYLRSWGDRISLCRIVHGGGKIYFHEIMDHRQQGITDSELEDAVRRDPGQFTIPGYHIISPQIETRLRTGAGFR
jgi:hypothetical protein